MNKALVDWFKVTFPLCDIRTPDPHHIWSNQMLYLFGFPIRFQWKAKLLPRKPICTTASSDVSWEYKCIQLGKTPYSWGTLSTKWIFVYLMRQVQSVPRDTSSGTTYHLTEGSTFLGNKGHHNILVTLPGEMEKPEKVHLSNIKTSGIHHVSPDSLRIPSLSPPILLPFDTCQEIPTILRSLRS